MLFRVMIRTAAAAVIAALFAAVVLLDSGARSVAGQGQEAAIPPDLALVPSDAMGFIHVQAAELWKSDLFARFRATYEKADPKARALLDAQFVPKPSTFERATLFVLPDDRQQNLRRMEPLAFGILRFSAPFEVAEVVTTYVPKATAERVDGKSIYRSDEAPFELYFPDHQTVVVGDAGTLASYLKHESPKTGPLSSGLKLAASGRPVVASVNIQALPIPREALAFAPDAAALLKAEYVTASLDLAKEARIDVVAGYKTAADAEGAEKAVEGLAALGRKELAKVKADIEKKLFDPKVKTPRPAHDLPETVLSVFALGGIAEADELLAHPGALVKRTGNNLTASIALPKEMIVTASGLTAVGVGLLLPAVQKVRMAAARAQSQNNLKQIALACMNYADVYGHMPQNITDKNGKPLLSWRVAILPFIEQNNLYQQFKLDEPWDSEHNKKWSEMVIKTYMSPDANPVPTWNGWTFYKAFAGPGTVFEPGKKIRFPADIPDGTSNTILVAEAGPAVPWAKPEDIPFDPKKPLPKLALPGVPDFINVALCDGSVRAINTKTITETTLKNAITRDDGQPLGSDW